MKKKKTKISNPLATASWLVSNTNLTFEQIADFCDIHPMNVASIGGNDVFLDVLPVSPIGVYLDKEEIEKCEKDVLRMLKGKSDLLSDLDVSRPKSKVYISWLQKRNRLDAILWMVSFSPTLSDLQIAKLVGSTKKTVSSIRSGAYSNMTSLVPKDPIKIGLCTRDQFQKAMEKSRIKESQ